MTKIRKQKRKKTFRYVNKKRQNNKRRKTANVQCKQIKESWDNRLTVQKNLENMGLAYDPNKAVSSLEGKSGKKRKGIKAHVVKSIEEDANELRENKLKIPKTQVLYLTNLMDKYGEDYKAMAKDPKNYYQETWKQIRAKIKTFKGIPEQYNEYLKRKGLEPTTTSAMEVETA
ncbi:nucleolar protein 16-like isoform X2 [Diaphorina citri]|uniref:Nucleolar protein 16 n=1 Tax=Diaphorina citri TaxID=121845 RepID=A0A1S4ENF9_DIACI|nr:nucleolar protein 16-like isoform X2 [Diaphorina citri]